MKDSTFNVLSLRVPPYYGYLLYSLTPRAWTPCVRPGAATRGTVGETSSTVLQSSSSHRHLHSILLLPVRSGPSFLQDMRCVLRCRHLSTGGKIFQSTKLKHAAASRQEGNKHYKLLYGYRTTRATTRRLTDVSERSFGSIGRICRGFPVLCCMLDHSMVVRTIYQ